MKKIEKSSEKSKKIRKGDKVIAIAGNNRGKTGTVLSCSGDKILVQGLNVRKKHVKPTRDGQRGGIIEMEAPIHVSNLKVCTQDGSPIKLKVREANTGERELVYQDNDQVVLYRSLKKS
jgi:large subunit ribosomal protein L24